MNTFVLKDTASKAFESHLKRRKLYLEQVKECKIIENLNKPEIVISES